jgi:ATP-dependent DNA ligase
MKPTRIYQGAYFDKLLADPAWVAELKYDGGRGCLYVLDDGSVELWDRHQNIVPAEIVPDIYAALRRLPLPPGAILDGEIYPRGFAGTKYPAPGKFKLALFDVLMNEPLRARQAALRGVIGDKTEGVIHYVDQAHEDKRAFFDRIWGDPKAEGIVLKRLDSFRLDDPRVTKDSPYWAKVVKPTKAQA